jgi:hypothetical protein
LRLTILLVPNQLLSRRVMKIEIGEQLPDPFSEEIRSVLRLVYEAGRAKGREEARREQQGLAEPPDATVQKLAEPNSKSPDMGGRPQIRGSHCSPSATKAYRQQSPLVGIAGRVGSITPDV